MSEERCTVTIYPKERYGSFKGHRCTKPLWKDGYCKIHHPESVEQRDKEATARWEAKRASSPENLLREAYKKLEAENARLREELEEVRLALDRKNYTRDDLILGTR